MHPTLSTRISGLNMRFSQVLAHLNANQPREHLLAQEPKSPAPSVSPEGSLHLPPESSVNTYLGFMELATARCRSNIPALPEGLLQSCIHSTLEHNTPLCNPRRTYTISTPYSHTGNYPPFPLDGTFPPTDASSAQPGLQYPAESSFLVCSATSANIGITGSMSLYVLLLVEHVFAVPPANSAGHRGERFSAYN
ncbi:hypothetical protein DFH29DRAFT_1006403 [Suillus ampliporus]|nr:hypothetical protein DFH29DRAFT_1006403 [Suillus ampliporus]